MEGTSAEKNKTVWEAILRVANTTNGEKILYEVYPINMVEAARKPGTSTTNDTVTQPDSVVKQKNPDRDPTAEATRAALEKENERLRSSLRELAAKLKNALSAYKDVKPDSPEGKMVAEMEDFRKEIMGIYTSALVDAGENFRENGGDKNTTREGGVKYSLNENAAVELHRALYDKSFNGEVLLRDVTPPIIVSQKGVRNLPMSMNASHIRENVFTEQEAKKMGLRTGKGINYHGLGEKFFLKIIDGLDSVKEAYRGTKNASKQERSENYFLLISTFTDKNGDIINVPVYINEHGNVNNVFLDVNKISTVFGRKNLREYIKRQVTNGDLVRIKNRSNQASESNAPIARDYGETASTRIIRNEEPVVNNESQEIFSDRDPTAEATRAALEKENERLRSSLRELAAKLKNALSAYKDVKPDSPEGKMVAEMEDFRKEIMGIYTSALVDAGENFRENGGDKNTTREGVRLQARQGGYDYSKPFDRQIDDWLKMDGTFPQNDTLLVGRTPKVLLDIGVPALPVTIAQKNLRETLLGQYKGTPQEIADHLISPEDMKSIPEKIANPVAIIADRRLVRNKWTVSESTIDVLIEMKINGKDTLVPVQITGTAKQHGMTIDANAISSVHGNKDTMQRLWYAVTNDTDENIMVFFADKNKTTAYLRTAGYPITSGPNISDGVDRSISDPNSPVKLIVP